MGPPKICFVSTALGYKSILFFYYNSNLSAWAATKDASLSWRTCSQTAVNWSKSKQPSPMLKIRKIIKTKFISNFTTVPVNKLFVFIRPWNFPRKKIVTPCWRYQLKIAEGRVKFVGIPGGIPKIEGNRGFSRESVQKNRKFKGDHGKFD